MNIPGYNDLFFDINKNCFATVKVACRCMLVNSPIWVIPLLKSISITYNSLF